MKIKFKEIKEKDLIPGEIYYDQPEENGRTQLEFVGFETDGNGKRVTALFKEFGEQNKYGSREEDGLFDFTYRENEDWYQPE